MRRIQMLALAGILLAAGLSFAADEKVAAEKPAAAKAIGLVCVGPVDTALADRVQKFVQENSALPVRMLPSQAAAGETLDDDAKAAAKVMTDSEVCLVVLDFPKNEIKAHGVLLPDIRVAVLNARSLTPADGDREKYARRLERETMHGLGNLLGVPNCPNPQCALSMYATDSELDNKGRNFCPPCLERVQKAAKDKSLQLIADSPYVVQ